MSQTYARIRDLKKDIDRYNSTSRYAQEYIDDSQIELEHLQERYQ